MKLVELLARELKVWPEHGCVQITQDKDKSVYYWRRDVVVFDGDEWSHEPGGLCDTKWFLDPMPASICTDHATAIVTRADWEAEVARLASVKPEWIRHRGGKCPVEAGVLVDVQHRDGFQHIGIRAGDGMAANWSHSPRSIENIMKYRLHDVSRDIDPECEEYDPRPVSNETIMAANAAYGNPIQWRDRIREIGITVEALEEERAGLVQQLEDEGFRLIGKVAEPAGDMSDWRNWRAGDMLTLHCPGLSDDAFENGKHYKFIKVDEFMDVVVIDDEGDENGFSLNSGIFKWHSRLSA